MYENGHFDFKPSIYVNNIIISQSLNEAVSAEVCYQAASIELEYKVPCAFGVTIRINKSLWTDMVKVSVLSYVILANFYYRSSSLEQYI